MSQAKNDKTTKSDIELTSELMNGGAEVAGSAVGAAIGLIGSPLAAVGGAAFGAAAGRALAHVGAELRKRMSGPRELVRVGAAAAFAGEIIAKGLQSGISLRDDGFFDENIGGRSSSKTVLEGVLMKARDSYEEKKLRLLGTLYASIAFRADVSGPYAYQMIKLAGEMTYRQFVLMSIVYEQTQRDSCIFKDVEFRTNKQAKARLTSESIGLLTEAYAIYTAGMAHSSDGSAWISLGDVNLGKMRLQGASVMLVQLTASNENIPQVDREDLLSIMQ